MVLDWLLVGMLRELAVVDDDSPARQPVVYFVHSLVVQYDRSHLVDFSLRDRLGYLYIRLLQFDRFIEYQLNLGVLSLPTQCCQSLIDFLTS